MANLPLSDAHPHLCLNAIESSKPQNLSSPQLSLCMVNFLIFFVHILFW